MKKKQKPKKEYSSMNNYLADKGFYDISGDLYIKPIVYLDWVAANKDKKWGSTIRYCEPLDTVNHKEDKNE